MTVAGFDNLPLSAAFTWGSSPAILSGALCVFLIYKHIMKTERERKTRSKIYTLIRPWVVPALMYTATTEVCVCVCVWDQESDFKKIISAQSMTLICTSQKTLCAWCCKIQGSFFLCSRRLPGAFERQFNDERQHAWMLVFCFRSQGKKPAVPKQF